MIILRIHGKLESLNTKLRTHWSKQNDRNKKLYEDIRLQIRSWENLNKQKALIMYSELSISFYFGKSKRDLDNNEIKGLIDSLKGVVIEDDNNKIITEIHIYYEPKLQWACSIVITELADKILAENQLKQIDIYI